MSSMKEEYYMIKGAILDLPEDQQTQIQQFKSSIKEILTENKELASIALVLATIELELYGEVKS